MKKILALEFVEMSELRADVWSEDPTPADTASTPSSSRAAVCHQHQDMDGVLRPTSGGASNPIPRKRARVVGITVHHSERSPQLRGGNLGGIRSPISAIEVGAKRSKLVGSKLAPLQRGVYGPSPEHAPMPALLIGGPRQHGLPTAPKPNAGGVVPPSSLPARTGWGYTHPTPYLNEVRGG